MSTSEITGKTEIKSPFALKALLVEDSPTNQKLGIRILEKLGCVVELAVNGKEAVDKVITSSFDVIFMDCQMPVMDGYTATRNIRSMENETIHTPIIAITARALSGDAEKCIAAGMDSYISKPITIKKVHEVIEKHFKQEENEAEESIIQPEEENEFGYTEEEMKEMVEDIVTEIKQISKDLKSLLPALEMNPDNSELREVVKRKFHTIKGTTSIISMPQITQTAEELEKTMKSIIAGEETVENKMDKIIEGNDALTKLIFKY